MSITSAVSEIDSLTAVCCISYCIKHLPNAIIVEDTEQYIISRSNILETFQLPTADQVRNTLAASTAEEIANAQGIIKNHTTVVLQDELECCWYRRS